MDLDLSRALHDAAQRGTAHRPALDAAPVLQRIRRRRTVRHAVEGTVGVAAVGAVAVGAAQGWDLRGFAPVRPVAPAPVTPTPSPSPTTSAVTGRVGCRRPRVGTWAAGAVPGRRRSRRGRGRAAGAVVSRATTRRGPVRRRSGRAAGPRVA